MNRAQTTGLLLMAGAVLQMLVFVVAIMRRSYVALALPVAAAMTALTALTFWVGWTLVTMEEDIDDIVPEAVDEE
jgi:hypothetical protein